MPHENMNRKHEDPPEEPLDVPGVLRPEASRTVDDEAGTCSSAVSLTQAPRGSGVREASVMPPSCVCIYIYIYIYIWIAASLQRLDP